MRTQFLLKFLFLLPSLAQSFSSLPKEPGEIVDLLIANLAESLPHQLVLMASKNLGQLKTKQPVINFELENVVQTMRNQENFSCPKALNDPGMALKSLKQREIVHTQHKPLHFIFVAENESSIDQCLELIELSFTNCSQLVHHGSFGASALITFVSNSKISIERALNHALLKKHPQTLGILRQEDKLWVYQRPPQREVDEPDVNFVWSPTKEMHHLSQIVKKPSSFGGGKFIVSTLNLGRPLDADGFLPLHLWSKSFYSIIVYELVNRYSGSLRVRPTLGNSLEGNSDLLKLDLVDMTTYDYLDYWKYKMTDLSPVIFSQASYATFVAPRPKQYLQSLALILPFDGLVWLIIIMSLFLAVISFRFLSWLQLKIHEDKEISSNSLANSAWMLLASLFQQDFAWEDAWRIQHKLRGVALLWVLFCFLLTTVYCGNLNSFLTKPAMDPAIESISDVLESGLKWKWFLFGTPSELKLAQSQHEHISRLWQGKEIIRAQDFRKLPLLMKEVAEGKCVLLGRSSHLSGIVDISFTAINGERMLHYPSSRPFPDETVEQSTMGLPKVGRWTHLINGFLGRLVEGGITRMFDEKSTESLRESYRQRGYLFPFELEARSMKLNIAELIDVLLLYLLLIGISFVAFCTELGAARMKEKKNKRDKEEMEDRNDKLN